MPILQHIKLVSYAIHLPIVEAFLYAIERGLVQAPNEFVRRQITEMVPFVGFNEQVHTLLLLLL
jgi:hypothetical protein